MTKLQRTCPKSARFSHINPFPPLVFFLHQTLHENKVVMTVKHFSLLQPKSFIGLPLILNNPTPIIQLISMSALFSINEGHKSSMISLLIKGGALLCLDVVACIVWLPISRCSSLHSTLTCLDKRWYSAMF